MRRDKWHSLRHDLSPRAGIPGSGDFFRQMSSPTIIIDTREQRPWTFPESVSVRRGTLRTGDYAIDGDESFAIERKSIDDFLGTVFSGWERFLREISRMDGAGFPCKVVIVEGDIHDFLFRQDAFGNITAPNHNHPRITPMAALGRISDLCFENVITLFCKDETTAAAMALSLLLKRNQQNEFSRDQKNICK